MSMEKRRALILQRNIRRMFSALLLSSVAFFGATFLSPPPVAAAHTLQAFVIGSDPVDGSTINRAPKIMRIFFNAPLSLLSVAHIYHIEQEQLVDVGSAPASLVQPGKTEMDIPVNVHTATPQGSYEVKWTAVADTDASTTYGVIGFNVGYSSTGLSGQSILGPETSNDMQALRTLDPLGLLTIGRISAARRSSSLTLTGALSWPNCSCLSRCSC